MFQKILIANRGEIALRIIRACQERGIQTIAIYSDADRSALHVRYADEAYRIGPPPASESYLRGDKIIDIARQAGADAIHPGYGFLAENAEFAAACRDAGVVFIGPTPEAIAAMGDKVTARETVAKAGVPLIPGTPAGLSDDELLAAAEEIGYPVLVKASAGGGGKGMRMVYKPEDLKSSLAAARRESLKAFGDDTIYLEKVVEGARHVEIQILADMHGNVIHLGERECSIQRRHQKLVEESPSVAVDDDLRARMGAVAVAAAKAVNYVSAGTVEFLLDKDKNFYFLEMNTRLQVEHPVTEMVTGVDIVKEMIAIADGRRLRLRQEDVTMKGWAIEARITAEDPDNNFMPSTGKVVALREPTGPGIRVESGIYVGMEVGLYYDPMIAKLIAYGDNRAEAILRLRRALMEYRIAGVKTSIPFHLGLMDTPRFQWGQFDTRFLETHSPPVTDDIEEYRRIAALISAMLLHERGQQAVTFTHDGGRADGVSTWRKAALLEGLRWLA
ncbi:MAG TPA: acetyl-CoA carboxylase biotin carboxylase subunit [Anaerolineae bacterium]|nr:acetyl-CoA carboxylase biotin carboxylase subunit [Caldilineae bacterium]HID35432.1 acetyl-CoA carboxylase biotin carboxylase subunit [Anaerolineae bacterium]HIQ11422.1 acetyl-CoA carboxylase biotin carboxylase subunit [Caldilineales bacterium]